MLDPQGFDAGKKVTGRKQHLLVDMLGLLLNVVVHRADVQDRDGARLVVDRRARRLFPSPGAWLCLPCRHLPQSPIRLCERAGHWQSGYAVSSASLAFAKPCRLLLVRQFDRHVPHCRAGDGLTNRFCIRSIRLVSLDVRLHIGWRHHADRVPQRGDLACLVVCARASFHTTKQNGQRDRRNERRSSILPSSAMP
jgi:hypothetical protein